MAVLATEKILTLDYWKRASDIEVGDYLFDRNGKPVQVKLVQEYRSDNCHLITLNDYLSISGDEKMSFLIETPKYRRRLVDYKGVQRFRRPLKPMALEQILNEELRTKHNRLSFSVPTCEPIQLPHQDHAIPAFIFGHWFFNRVKNNNLIVSDYLCNFIKEKYRDHGYEFIKTEKRQDGAIKFTTNPTIESQLIPLIPNRIPNNYLMGSEEQRLELLRGIMHAKTRQYDPKIDRFRFTTTFEHEIKAIQFLTESLGIKTRLIFDERHEYFTLYFRTTHKIVENQTSKPKKVHQSRRFIQTIDKLAPQSCVHIETDGPDGTFLVGEGFIACR